MKKKLLFITGCLSLALRMYADGTIQVPMRATYDKPAQEWESQALPIGNGWMGAMIFGGVYSEIIQVNEHSLWSGGPSENPNYDGGHLYTQEQNHQTLQNLRKKLQEKGNEFASNNTGGTLGDYDNNGVYQYTNKFGGTKDNFGSYQTVGNILIRIPEFTTVDPNSIYCNYDNTGNASQNAQKMFDSNNDTKWYADKYGVEFPIVIRWAYKNASNFKSYSVTSGGDMPERDPQTWTLFGSADGNEWVELDHQDGDIWGNDRKSTKTFPLTSCRGYKYFKMEITALKNNNESPQLSEISMDVAVDDTYTNYNRTLDIDQALHQVSYTDNGVNYTRTYFMSYPDNVMVMRLTADKPFTRNISIDIPHSDKEITVTDKAIEVKGYPTPTNGQRTNDAWKNGLRFAQVLKVHSTDGTVEADDDHLCIKDAKEIVLVMNASTNYRICKDKTFNFFSPEEPIAKSRAAVEAVASKSYDDLLAAHEEDYKSLYDRNQLNLGNITANNIPAMTTAEALSKYKNNELTAKQQLYMQTLYYQFGRYLMISSSRPGTLPANLQGVWAQSLNNPWSADYHTNINVQMNYWLTGSTNLDECAEPLIEFIETQRPRGEYTAQHYYCKPDGGKVRGWVCNHEANIFANTAPATAYENNPTSAHIFPEGAAWMCQHIWDQYEYTQDIDFLARHYETLLQAALFWVDDLWTDTRDNTLVVSPSFSPEHGSISMGCTSSQGLVYELFDIVQKAAKELGYSETDEVKEVKEAMAKMSMPKIGTHGQFQEWKDETALDVNGDNHHRHANHLVWLHPGTQVIPGRSAQEDEWAEAMKVTLNTRGDGGTGWSRAWKANFWARLHDGEHASQLVHNSLLVTGLNAPGESGGVYENLFDVCPPFQIDGNFGISAAIAEMLLQSHGGYLQILPALPTTGSNQWAQGEAKGLKARGNFDVDIKWSSRSLTLLGVRSNAGKPLTLKYKGIGNMFFSVDNVTIVSDDEITIPTTAGQQIFVGKTQKLVDNAVATDIGTLKSNVANDDKVYTIDGKQVPGVLGKGVYIKNHKKYIKK